MQRPRNAATSGAEMANTATLKPAKPQAPATAVAPASPPLLAFSMLSHRGRVRHVNQDACAAQPDIGIFVVCDGMGGAAAGEVASRLAAQAFLDFLSRPSIRPQRRIPPKPASGAPVNGQNSAAAYPAKHPHTRLHQAVEAANDAVYRHSRKAANLQGMGTTLVSALWDASNPATFWLANVGDSRCYRLRRGELQLLTEDHSLVEEQVRAGVLSRVEAATSPIRNIITRAIGSQPLVEPDIAPHQAQPGDLYLLASDGLTRELDDAEIGSLLALTSGQSLDETCKALVDAANANGGRDNITVLLISCN
ncbi:MAG: protein phosphatase 2C domain-containing protein [Acidobacteriota bacterium]|nr:protein phosphatase 2C domain-containing protein [Acidobacteriota bacterium]